MPTSRSYGDACGIGRALDVVGERWALHIVRELLLGPQRFSDLRNALPNASSNVVTDRLRELEGHGVVRRRKMSPPAGSWVYELTEWGREIEPVLLALGGWGLRVEVPGPPTTLSGTSVMLFLRSCARSDLGDAPIVLNIALDNHTWTVRSAEGRVDIEVGESLQAQASLRTDPHTLNMLVGHPGELDAALSDGRAFVEGDVMTFRRLLRNVVLPAPGNKAQMPLGQ
jgi:DNA-binding HxlR family transcriptional regulator